MNFETIQAHVEKAFKDFDFNTKDLNDSLITIPYKDVRIGAWFGLDSIRDIYLIVSDSTLSKEFGYVATNRIIYDESDDIGNEINFEMMMTRSIDAAMSNIEDLYRADLPTMWHAEHQVFEIN